MMSTDDDLLAAWKAGDVAAGSALFDRHFDAVYGFFRGKTLENIDDLVQKTFLACIEGARERFRGDSTFRTYLLGIAKNVLCHSLSVWQRDARRIDSHVSGLHDVRPLPSQVLMRHHELRAVFEGLRRISAEQQVVIELYYLEGCRGSELARVLEIPEATVRSRLRRGLAALRRHVAVDARFEGAVERDEDGSEI